MIRDALGSKRGTNRSKHSGAGQDQLRKRASSLFVGRTELRAMEIDRGGKN